MAVYYNAPTYIGVGTFNSGISAIAPGIPSGYRNDDLFLLFVETANEAVTAPTGWTEITNSPQSTGSAASAGGVRLTVYWKIASGIETAPTIADSGNHQTAQIMCIRGVDAGSPFEATAGSAASANTAMTWPTVTTTVPQTLIVNAAAMDTDADSTATVTGWTNSSLFSITERIDQTISSGVGGGLAVATGLKSLPGAVSATTATGSTSVTHAYLTIAVKGKTPIIRPYGQYLKDYETPVSVGGNVVPGSTDGIRLAVDISPAAPLDVAVIPKVEVEDINTTFDNTATVTARTREVDSTDVIYGARGGSLIHDEKNDRYIFFGGYDGTTRYNIAWEKDMTQPGQPWRRLSPSGTPPSGRNLGAACYVRGTTSGSVDKSYMVIWGGFASADTNDMFTLDLTTPGSEAWTTITQTSALSARSYNTRHMVATPVSGDTSQNYIYLFGGWGSTRENVLVRCTFDVDSPTAVTWTTLKANGAGGNPTGRSGAVLDYKASTGKLYLYGGMSDAPAYLNDFWEYDIAGNTWTNTSPTGTASTGTELLAGGYDAVNNKFWFAGGWTGTTAATIRNNIGYISNVGGSEAYVEARPNDADNRGFCGGASIASWVDKTRNYLIIHGMQQVDSTEVYSYIIDLNETSDETYKTAYGMSEGQDFTIRDAPTNVVNPTSGEVLAAAGFSSMYNETTIVNGTHVSDLWAYNPTANTWRFAVAGHKSIQNTEGVASCWDSTRGRMILFGGLSGASERNNEVWTFTPDANGNYKARNLKPTGTRPGARWLCHMAYDATNDRALVVMGGNDTTVSSEIWELSFTGSADGAWTQRTPTGTAPTSVVGGAYANATNTSKLYIYGGASNTGLTTVQSQLSYLDYSTTNCAWTVMSTTGGLGRRTHSLGYDQTNNYLISFGGFSGSAVQNTQQFLNLASPTAWTTVTTSVTPDARRSAGYGFVGGKLYIHSGRTDSGKWFKNTWELTPNYGTPNSSTWVNKAPRTYVQSYFTFTNSNLVSWHWQSWINENGAESAKYSFGSNTDGGLAYIGSDSLGSATMSAALFSATDFQAGDVILMFAFRDGSTTAPSLASGWTSVGVNTGTLTSTLVAYKVVGSTHNEPDATFTNATKLSFMVYRGAYDSGAPIVNSGAVTGTGSTVNYAGITTMTAPGQSWVARFAGHGATNTSLETPPSGFTFRTGSASGSDETAGFDSNGPANSSTFAGVSVGGTSDNWISKTLEILVKNPMSYTGADFLFGTTPLLAETLQDNFDDNSLDSSKWLPSNGAQSVETNQELEITPINSTGSYETVESVSHLDLTSSYVAINIIDIGNLTVPSYEAYPLEIAYGSDRITMCVATDSVLHIIKNINGVATTLASPSWNATTMAWIRIREDSGTVYIDRSADGLSWTNMASETVALLFPMKNIVVRTLAGMWQAEATSTKMKVDNFNVLPTGGSTTGHKKVYIGGAWVGKPVKVYVGGAWTEKPVKVNRSGTWGNSNS